MVPRSGIEPSGFAQRATPGRAYASASRLHPPCRASSDRPSMVALISRASRRIGNRVATVERLVDRRRRIDRLAVRPHTLVPAFGPQLVRLAEQRFALCPEFVRLPSEYCRHGASFAELLLQRIAILNTCAISTRSRPTRPLSRRSSGA
jgi:hypothetical protein